MKTSTELRQTIVNLRNQLEKKNQDNDRLRSEIARLEKELEHARTATIIAKS